MRVHLKAALPAICAAGLWLAVSLLPAIPVEYSPVVPDPVPTSTVVSLQGIFLSPFLCGVHLQATWATFPAMLGLSAAAIVAGWKMGRQLAGR
jgi:hypothetical protein